MKDLESLKAKLIEASVLVLPHSQGHHAVDTGYCDKHIAYVLFQKQSNKTDIQIGYWSRSIFDDDKAYDSTCHAC